MLLDLIFGCRRSPEPVAVPEPAALQVGGRSVPLRLVRHPRARRYLLRLLPDGSARVTVPRGGTLVAARQFAERQTGWLETQLQKLQHKPRVPTEWVAGSEILFRGEKLPLQCPAPGLLQLGTESIKTGGFGDFRPVVQQHLHRLAARELPPRVFELARQHQVAVTRVSVRNQRSRWGSCSRTGTISLNWRLIQAPAYVSDYVILHELMHRRQLNHSARFWQEVAAVCPAYPQAELWLKQHSAILK